MKNPPLCLVISQKKTMFLSSLLLGCRRCKPTTNLLRRDSRDTHHFTPVRFAARYGNGRTWNLEQIGEEFYDFLIRFAFHRLISQPHLQHVSHHPCDHTLL